MTVTNAGVKRRAAAAAQALGSMTACTSKRLQTHSARTVIGTRVAAHLHHLPQQVPHEERHKHKLAE
jgi:hypothetical protein